MYCNLFFQTADSNETVFDPFVENPVPTAIGLFALAITIIVLNSVAILVFLRKRSKVAPFDYPLLSLLVANLLQGTLTLPAYALKKIDSFGDFEKAITCDVYRFSFFVCAHASIMSLLVSNVDRLIALLYSLRYWEIVTKTRISVVVLFTWLFVICFDMVPLFTADGDELCHYKPTKQWSVSMHIVMNIIPLPLLLAGYIATIRIAYKHARKNDPFKSKNLRRRDKVRIICGIRATKKVMLIIGSYFICVGPACVYYLLEWLCLSCFTKDYKMNREQYARFFLKILVNIYAVVSAVIFYWNSKDFRRKVREVLSGREKSSTLLDNLDNSNKKSARNEECGEKNSGCSSLISLKPREPDFDYLDECDGNKKDIKKGLIAKTDVVRGIFSNSPGK